MVRVRWKLRGLLEELGQPASRVEETARGLGYSLGRNAIYRLTGSPPDRIAFSTVAALLHALRDLTGRELGVGDLLEVEYPAFHRNPVSGKPRNPEIEQTARSRRSR